MINYNDDLFQLPSVCEGAECFHYLLGKVQAQKDIRLLHDLLGHVIGGALLTMEGEWEGGSDIWTFYVVENIESEEMALELWQITGEDFPLQVFSRAQPHVLPRCINLVRQVGGRQVLLNWCSLVWEHYKKHYQ